MDKQQVSNQSASGLAFSNQTVKPYYSSLSSLELSSRVRSMTAELWREVKMLSAPFGHMPEIGF